METRENNKRRVRRTNVEIDRDIMEALKELVEEVGFSNITLTRLIRKAKVEANVLYNRFGDLDNLFEKFVQRYDYWLNEILTYNIDDFDESNHEEYLKQMLSGLAGALYTNQGMQQILVWEISEKNLTTSRAAKSREENLKRFVTYYQNIFKDTKVNTGALSALVIGGIYYLILRKDRSAFCGIDFTTEIGKEKLITAIRTICSSLFLMAKENYRVIEIARKMKNKGIDNTTISDCTGLTKEEITMLT